MTAGAGAGFLEVHDVLTVHFEDSVFIERIDMKDLQFLEFGVADTGKTTSFFMGLDGGMQSVTPGVSADYVTFSTFLPWSDYSVAGIEGYRLSGGIPSGTGASPMPEPEAAILFPIGALIVGYAIRKQRLATT